MADTGAQIQIGANAAEYNRVVSQLPKTMEKSVAQIERSAKSTSDAMGGMMRNIEGKGLRGAFKGIGSDLAQATTPMEAFQSIATRAAGAFGKVTSAVAGFAVGHILAGQVDKMAESVKKATDGMHAFNSSFDGIASANTFDSAIAGFKSLGSEIDKVKASIDEIKGGVFTNLFDRLSGGATTGQLAEALAAMEKARSGALALSMARQRQAAEDMLSSGGNKEAMERIALQAQRDAQRRVFQDKLDGSSIGSQAAIDAKNSLEDLNAKFSAEDKLAEMVKNESKRAKEQRDQEAVDKAQKEAHQRAIEYNDANTKWRGQTRPKLEQQILTMAATRGVGDDIDQERADMLARGTTADLMRSRSRMSRMQQRLSDYETRGAFGAAAGMADRIAMAGDDMRANMLERLNTRIDRVKESMKQSGVSAGEMEYRNLRLNRMQEAMEKLKSGSDNKQGVEGDVSDILKEIQTRLPITALG